ncbi:MAG TPA: ABC transporter permease [Phycisphaerae bacterium]|jgi:putative ABC transport system permease protein
MTTRYVLWQNLLRNPLRTILTAVAFALPMAIFVAAISLVSALIEMGKANERQLRLAVHHKTTIVNLLPEAVRRRVEGLDPQHQRLTAVCGMRWFGGKVPDTQNTLTSLAADPDTFPLVYSDADMTPDETAAWNRDRRACVLGFAIAERYRWKSGDRIVLVSTVPPYLQLEFYVAKVMTAKTQANYFYFRRDYLTESLKEALPGLADAASRCNIFWIKCNSAADLHSLQGEIDALFANTPDETKSEDENAFGANFTQAAGDIPGLMRAMAMVVVFVIALVAGNTMMMSFRERTRELAVFKAIGFQSRRVFFIVLAESLLLALLGSLLGVVPVSALLWFFPVRGLGFGPISALEISPFAVIGSLAMAMMIGLAAGLWPAYQAVRLRTVDALRRVA